MNTLKTFFLLGLLSVVLVLGGGAIAGPSGMKMAFIMALAMNFFSYWFSDKIVLAMMRAHPVSREDFPWLFNMVEDLSKRANLPMPKLYVIEDAAPNAFATGRSHSHSAVAVTSGIIRLMDRDELRGVLGHELAHIKNRDMLLGTMAATLAGAITYLAQMAMFFGGGRRRDGEGGHPAAALLMMIVGPIAAMLIQMAISRTREYAADRLGSEIAGNPRFLSGGLKKLMNHSRVSPVLAANPAAAHLFIVNPLSGRGFVNMFSTHPPLEERIRRLEAMA